MMSPRNDDIWGRPPPPLESYLKCFINKLENFIWHLRWKAQFFSNQEHLIQDGKIHEKIGSTVSPRDASSQHEGFIAFEADLYEMAHSIQFKKAQNSFLSKLSKDARNINASTSLLIPADKTTNHYKVKTVDYHKLLQDNVSAMYKKTDSSSV